MPGGGVSKHLDGVKDDVRGFCPWSKQIDILRFAKFANTASYEPGKSKDYNHTENRELFKLKIVGFHFGT